MPAWKNARPSSTSSSRKIRPRFLPTTAGITPVASSGRSSLTRKTADLLAGDFGNDVYQHPDMEVAVLKAISNGTQVRVISLGTSEESRKVLKVAKNAKTVGARGSDKGVRLQWFFLGNRSNTTWLSTANAPDLKIATTRPQYRPCRGVLQWQGEGRDIDTDRRVCL